MNEIHVATYRRLTRLYPKSFRDEYRADLIATFGQQLADDGRLRSWLRTSRDLILTLPSQHLEARMNRPPVNLVAATAFAVAIAATIGAIFTGGSVYALILVLIAFVAVCIAVLAWRASRPALLFESTRSWKGFLASGVVLLATMIVIVNLPLMEDGDYVDGVWYVMFFSVVLSIILIAFGVISGLANRLSRKPAAR